MILKPLFGSDELIFVILDLLDHTKHHHRVIDVTEIHFEWSPTSYCVDSDTTNKKKNKKKLRRHRHYA